MSLNDYFAANGAVYLRSVGLPDCFPLPGLPHGCKPPPLSMQHPSQKPRTMAAVSPLHPVAPPPQQPPSGYEGGFGATSRTSSFAAALRKLAKQAVDPVSGEKDLSQISPVASPVLSQGSLTPKRSGTNTSMYHQGSYVPSSPPPVVTIAPSRPVATHTSDSRKVNNSSSLSNGQLQESLNVKMDSSKGSNRSSHSDKWEESSKTSSSASSQVRPHATIAPLPRPDDSLTSSRGFQPYRGTEDNRNNLPHHLSLFDHHPAYPYTPAFLPPTHLAHPAYRFDDPLYLERYSLLRPPVMPYPQPGMMGPPPAFYPNSRYAADLLAQSLSLGANPLLNHERLKQEEERRMREKELELESSRNKEQERQREKEQQQREKEHKEKREKSSLHRDKEENSEQHSKKHSSGYSSSSKRTESPNVKSSSASHSMPNHTLTPTTAASSIPLNLVVQSNMEPIKRETELWMPWQQPVTNHFPKENHQDMVKHPVYRTQDNHRNNFPKENHTNDKVNLRFSPTILNEKKNQNMEPPAHNSDIKRFPAPPEATTKRYDPPPSQHHHNELPATKDAPPNQAPHEWRHEKLQKACTNNHRKSHESKKACRSNSLQNHQPKTAANGAVLKPGFYQNEGMHARLLESEKCRLEMNGHTTFSRTYPTCTNDRLPNSNKSSNVPQLQQQQQPVTATTPQKPSFGNDFFSSTNNVQMLKSSVELTPVVSKLDLDAKRFKKRGLKYCDDEAKENLRLKNFLILTKVPKAKHQSNPKKMKFLHLLGLTTQHKRKRMEFDTYLKRRKFLREESDIFPLSPEPEKEDKFLSAPAPENNVQSNRLSEQLLIETKPIKLEFLFKVGLTPITIVKKEERERIRRIVEEEKIRRYYRNLAKVNRKSSPRRLFVPKSEAALKLDQLRKLREMNNVANEAPSNQPTNNNTDDRKVLPKIEQVPYQCETGEQESPSQPKTFNKYSFKRGHSLKNEFRFATPQPVHKNNHGKKTVPVPKKTTSVTTSTQVDPSVFSNAADKSLADLKNTFNWPGLDAIIEAFYKHQNEQSSEKGVLSERWQQLRQTQDDLKKEADALTRQMSDLLRSKRELDDERQKHENAIDHLKKCLHIGR